MVIIVNMIIAILPVGDDSKGAVNYVIDVADSVLLKGLVSMTGVT